MSGLSSSTPSFRKIAVALVSRICGVYFGLARKVISPRRAISSPAAAAISSPGSPCSIDENVHSASSESFIAYLLNYYCPICNTISSSEFTQA